MDAKTREWLVPQASEDGGQVGHLMSRWLGDDAYHVADALLRDWEAGLNTYEGADPALVLAFLTGIHLASEADLGREDRAGIDVPDEG